MQGVGATARQGAIASIALLGLFTSGCAQVTVIGDQGQARSEWKFGVLAIDIAGSSRNTIVQSTGWGLVTTPSGATLGYANARIVRLGDECRLVIATHDLDAISRDPELARRLRATHNACAA